MVLGIPGTEGLLGNFNLSETIAKVGQLAGMVIMFLLVAGVWGLWYWRRKNKKLYNKRIFWFEEIHGDMAPIGEDWACELKIPGTNLTVFYIKTKDMYMPRPIKKMGKDAYWMAIRNNREIVNFAMKNINDEMKHANLDYDHTDQRYALTNLLAIIKRNYRDKATPWWREYKDVIAVVVLIFVLTLSFFFLFTKVGTLLDKAGVLIDTANKLVQSASQVTPGSGVTPA